MTRRRSVMIRRGRAAAPSLLRYNDANCAESIAEPAAFAFHKLSRTRALQAFGYHLEFGICFVRRLARSHFYDLAVVILSQPGCQLAFSAFPVCDAEPDGLRRPPGWNAVIADDLTTLEQPARIGAAEKLSALGTAF